MIYYYFLYRDHQVQTFLMAYRIKTVENDISNVADLEENTLEYQWSINQWTKSQITLISGKELFRAFSKEQQY